MTAKDFVSSVTWLWKTNKNDPWYFPEKEEIETDKWTSYSNIETVKIEEKYQEKATEVILNDYRIDFKHFVHISNWNGKRERLVKRVTCDIGPRKNQTESQRNEWLLPTPLPLTKSFGQWGKNGLRCFLLDVESCFNLRSSSLQHESIRRQMVEKAAEGLITEGDEKSKEMAQELINIKNGTLEEVAKKCAFLYTKESFLYRKLNELSTFGSFALFLSALPEHGSKDKMTVYRSANLTEDMIDQYREAEGSADHMTFPAFTSTTRNSVVAEIYDGNVLFKIDIIPYADAVDVSSYSNFPDEEEMLLNSYFSFSIQSCIFDIITKKWTIHLQSFNVDDEPPLCS
ncbi:unnamed protein product [Rotaria magnacalcarata]